MEEHFDYPPKQSMEEYKIPENIKILLDKNFLELFLKNLKEVFKTEDLDDDVMCCIGGTNGWHKALLDTCFELKKLEIMGYYDKLEWFDSDYFDGEISDIMLDLDIIKKGNLDSSFFGDGEVADE